jgi:ATP-dependent RNA/DNA helicase IGHMBP2
MKSFTGSKQLLFQYNIMSDQVVQYFEQLSAALATEKQAEIDLFQKKIAKLPLADTIKLGYAWHPLKMVQSGFTFSRQVFVTLERTTNIDQPHQLRSGATVKVFNTQLTEKTQEIQGIIHFVQRNRMKITLYAQDVPDWIDNMNALIGVQLQFDNRSYQEMELALKQVRDARGTRLAELRDILIGQRSKSTIAQAITPPFTNLNDSQNKAVHLISASYDVSVVHGPPGTGKTTTLVAAIKHLSQTESTILVCASSNAATDLLTERIAESGVHVVRIGNVSRVDESVMSHTLDMTLLAHPESKNVKKIKIKAAELRKQAGTYKRTFGRDDAHKKRQQRQEANELMDWATQLENRIIDQILSGAQVITCTLVGAAASMLTPYKFRTVVIDEAAQALEPASWIPILKASRVVLAGDPFQLPPTVKSNAAAKMGLNHTLIEKCLKLIPDVHLLDTQYRMNNAIMGFSNAWFYGNSLKAAEQVADHRLVALGGENLTLFEPIVFIDTAGCDFEEKTHKDSIYNSSRYNQGELLILREHFLKLSSHFSEHFQPDIAIISPYREQVTRVEQLFREEADLAPFVANNLRPQVTISTIDGFQGQERDIVYLSLVRSNPKAEIGFLSDFRRMNVAMTRARKLLVVIGDSATIGKTPFYEAFMEYVEKNGSYQTAWQYMA